MDHVVNNFKRQMLQQCAAAWLDVVQHSKEVRSAAAALRREVERRGLVAALRAWRSRAAWKAALRAQAVAAAERLRWRRASTSAFEPMVAVLSQTQVGWAATA